MSPRERVLLIVLIFIFVFGGGYVGVAQMYLPALKERDKKKEALEDDLMTMEMKRDKIFKDRPRFDLYKKLSLAPSIDLDHREYEKFLRRELGESGFSPEMVMVKAEQTDQSTSPKTSKKEPIYIILPFKVEATGQLGNIVSFLEEFYHASFLHRIKSISIQRPQTTAGGQQTLGDLKLDLTIEALVVQGTPKRDHLQQSMDTKEANALKYDALAALMETIVPGGNLARLGGWAWALGPTGPTGPRKLAEPSRQYAYIAARNIFTGPSLLRPLQTKEDENVFVYLTEIRPSALGAQAFLYDRYNAISHRRLRPTRGYDTFPLVRDHNQEILVQGVVVKVDVRDLIFRVQLNARDTEQEQARLTAVSDAQWRSIADKSEAAKAKGNLIYHFEKSYWDELVEAKLIRESRGSVTFRSGDAVLLNGKVLRSNSQEVYLGVDQKMYCLHIGTNVANALQKPLTSSELEKFEVREHEADKLSSRTD